jgi:hypothetical protein
LVLGAFPRRNTAKTVKKYNFSSGKLNFQRRKQCKIESLCSFPEEKTQFLE